MEENASNPYIDFLAARLDKVIATELGSGPATVPTSPVAKPMTILGLPLQQALLYLGLGIAAIFVAKWMFK